MHDSRKDTADLRMPQMGITIEFFSTRRRNSRSIRCNQSIILPFPSNLPCLSSFRSGADRDRSGRRGAHQADAVPDDDAVGAVHQADGGRRYVDGEWCSDVY